MVVSSNILRDTIFYVKDFLDGEITDPISSTRPANQKFIMTSYPQRPVQYPLITIKDINSSTIQNLGFQSEAQFHGINIEIRCWGRNIKERDDMADSVFQKLKDNQIGAVGTSQANDLHDLKLLSSINLDDPDGAKSKIMTYEYKFVAT